MSYISYNLRFWRTKKGLSQQKFAEELGVTRGMLATYEESVEPRQEFLMTIVEKYHVNLHYFFTRKMTDGTFETFFLKSADENISIEQKQSSTAIIGLLYDLIDEQDKDKRNQIARQVTMYITRMTDENNEMKDELYGFMKRMMA
ncbi:MAG: helix-turn-helix transcriptional regulator [Cytophagales bacterium]|nr:helix-turn-helix transcriptional regulator [Cytophagales bacterium]